MNKIKAFVVLIVVLSLSTLAYAQVPGIISYQGRVIVAGTNFNGTGQFKFALVAGSGATTYWSNDGSSVGGSQPTLAVPVPVSKGLYEVLLGDTSLSNMTVSIPATVFTNSDVRLRMWFSDGINGVQQLSPDQRIASVGYAMMAGTASNAPWSGLTGAQPKVSAATNADVALNLVGSQTIALTNAFNTANSNNTAIAGLFSTQSQHTATLAAISGLASNSAQSITLNNTTVFSTNGNVNLGTITGGSSIDLTARGMAAMVGSNTVGIITNYNATDVVINGINLGTGGGLFGTTFGNATLSLGGIGNSYYVACGFGALQNATDIQDVVAVGFGALSSLIMGRQEVAVGTVSLASLTNGMANTGVGESVLTALKNGSNNTAVGNGASEELLSGNANSTFGTHCLWALTNGYGNVAFGQDAGRYQNSGATLSNALNSIYIGTSASALADGANNEIVIGTSAAGNGNNTAVIGSPVQPYLQTNFTAYGTFSFGQPINGHMAILFTDGTNLWFSNVNGVINKLTSN